MKCSSLGAIDILGHEGICLSPYLDSVGVWTIGGGVTSSDGVRVNISTAPITLAQAIAQFIEKLRPYDDAVSALGPFTQYQHDALTSCCYNFGAGNLHQLCAHRTLEQIGAAIMLYRKPPEITARRRSEQHLYLTGQYSNRDGTTLLFPVTANHHPDYHRGHTIDVRPYFKTEPTP